MKYYNITMKFSCPESQVPQGWSSPWLSANWWHIIAMWGKQKTNNLLHFLEPAFAVKVKDKKNQRNHGPCP